MVKSVAKKKSISSPSKPLIRQTSSTKTQATTTNANALKLLSPNRHFPGSQVAMDHELARLTAAAANKNKNLTDSDVCDVSAKIIDNQPHQQQQQQQQNDKQLQQQQKLSKDPSSSISKRSSNNTTRHASTIKKRTTSKSKRLPRRVEETHIIEWRANSFNSNIDKTIDLAASESLATTPLMTSHSYQSCSTASSPSPTSGAFPYGFSAISTIKQETRLANQQQAPPDDVIKYFEANQQAWGYLKSLTDGVESYGLAHFGRSLSELQSSYPRSKNPCTPSGFLIGSDESCDIRISNLESRHSFIYMRWYCENEVYLPQLLILDRSNSGLLLDGQQIEKAQETNLLRHDYGPGDNTQATHIQNGQLIQLNGETPEANVTFQLYIAAKKIEGHAANISTIGDLYYYDTNHEIGNGQYGYVYRAVCRSTNKVVALKKLDLDAQPINVINALRREAAINVLLKPHPCIIQFENVIEEYSTTTIAHQVFRKSKNVYIIMEHGRDGDLFDLVNGSSLLPEDKVIVIFDQLFHAISHLHNQDIAHRDLKLENVVVLDKKKFRVKLCDFGLATFDRSGHTLFSKCGTQQYSAPEVLMANDEKKNGYTKAIDIWSLGIMLICTITKYSPYTDLSPEAILQYIHSEEFPDLSANRWSEISDDAKDLLKKMLVVDPRKRLTIDQVLAHPWAQRAKVLRRRNASLVNYLNSLSSSA